MKVKTRVFSLALAIVVTAFICFAAVGYGEGALTVKRIGNIHPYAENAFRINAPESGLLEIRIHDNICVYRTITESIQSGETTISWDGCGYNSEKLYEKTYTVTAELTGDSGQTYKVSFDSPVEYAAQCLQYALPSSDILYLDDLNSWFIEYRTVTNGTVIIEIRSVSVPEETYLYSIQASGGKIARKDLEELAGKKKIPPEGEYILSVYEKSKKEETYDYPLHILNVSPDPAPVCVTGEIMADRSMSDSEIWEMMMKPSVVINIDSFRHQDVYAEKSTGSPSLGTLHGQSQGVKVIRIEDEWALIGAWNHEEAEYVEGWVPLEKLKTEEPRGKYGLLIDKQKQTMTVYQNGKVIDTLLVSTGRAEKGSLFQETSAGCFLTGYHRVNFSMNGKKYDYVIQYDGGNLLHQTPYDWGQHKKDFTLGRAYLGAKASHACIRIQPEPGDGGLNAYWLFTHIPYHTRVMILDDPWEHESVAAKLKRGKNDDVDLAAINIQDPAGQYGEKDVAFTFGGSITPGGNRAVNNKAGSFSSMVKNEGYDIPLSGLKEILSEDDMTYVSLGCAIHNEQKDYSEDRNAVTASFGTERIFAGASIELIGITGERILSSGQELIEKTAEALSPYTDVLMPGQIYICTLKGHRFGFAEVTEREYLTDPEIIDEKLAELKTAGCEKRIMLIQWSEGHESAHSIVQEAMAHRSVRAGADLVVGNCPGVIQGFDLIDNVPVIYSTGDLLNGSITNKPKNQQGILARVVFSFEDTKSNVSVTLIPIMPYGSSDGKQNEYRPSETVSREQVQKVLHYIWQDSTDAALEMISFRICGQS